MPTYLSNLTLKRKNNFNDIVTELDSYNVMLEQTLDPICL